jgi:group I intron endonuclease
LLETLPPSLTKSNDYGAFKMAAATISGRVSGVYAIRNLVSGRIYVGSSANIKHRWMTHRHQLNNGTHHSRLLQRSWEKHGAMAFSFEIIEIVETTDDLLSREQYWIDALNSHSASCGFNILKVAGSPRGHKFSAATRAKMSAVRLGKKLPTFSVEHRAALSASRKGKPNPAARYHRTDEWRAKMSAARLGVGKGKPRSAAVIAKLRKPKSPSHAGKLRIILAARNQSAEMRQRTAARNRLGRKTTIAAQTQLKLEL